MVLRVAHPDHGSPCEAHAVIFFSPCLLSGHVACKSHDGTSSVSRSNSRAVWNVKGWFARIKMRVRAPRGIRAPLKSVILAPVPAEDRQAVAFYRPQPDLVHIPTVIHRGQN